MRPYKEFVFAYQEDCIYFKVFKTKKKIKVYAKFNNKTVIEYGNNALEAGDKAKERLTIKY